MGWGVDDYPQPDFYDDDSMSNAGSFYDERDYKDSAYYEQTMQMYREGLRALYPACQNPGTDPNVVRAELERLKEWSK